MTAREEDGLPGLDLTAIGYLTTVGAARALGIHRSTVEHLRTNGRMPGWEKHFGCWLIPRERLERFAAHYNPRRGGERCKS